MPVLLQVNPSVRLLPAKLEKFILQFRVVPELAGKRSSLGDRSLVHPAMHHGTQVIPRS